ncbi:exosortase N [Rufibacter hautae]|nr:exosortase N [Rufibacter hautae]
MMHLPLNSSRLLLPQRYLLAWLIGMGYLLTAAFFLRQYLLWNPQWLLGLALLPFITLRTPQKTSPLLLLVTGCILAFSGYYQITTVYFFGFLLVLWFAAQTLLGRSGIYPLLMLSVASPIFGYVADILSFPLRLELTRAAAFLIGFMYDSAKAAGNIILLNGQEYSVDPACAGLHLLSFSFMIAVFLLAHVHRTQQKAWTTWMLFGLLLLVLGLNLVSNLLRILVLVLLQIGPSNPMHDVVGLLCLVLYTLLPFYFLARKASMRLPRTEQPETPQWVFPKKVLWLHVGLLVSVTVCGFKVQQKKVSSQIVAQIQAPGFQKELLQDGVHKFTNEKALIYMKPIRAFYSTEHHPMICWEGSGYLFQNISLGDIGGHLVYTGILKKEKALLHTAWWMDNGQYQTVEQADWRWRMAKGEPAFHLVNVTAASEEELVRQVTQLLESKAITNKVAHR